MSVRSNLTLLLYNGIAIYQCLLRYDNAWAPIFLWEYATLLMDQNNYAPELCPGHVQVQEEPKVSRPSPWAAQHAAMEEDTEDRDDDLNDTMSVRGGDADVESRNEEVSYFDICILQAIFMVKG